MPDIPHRIFAEVPPATAAPVDPSVERYLASRHATIWPGHIFDLTSTKERQAAARWLAGVLKDLGYTRAGGTGSYQGEDE